MGRKKGDLLPFHVNVAHLLPGDAEVIQDHILGVPDNTTQEKPAEKMTQIHTIPTKGGRSLTKNPRSLLTQDCCLPGWTLGLTHTRVAPEWQKARPKNHLLVPSTATTPHPAQP